MIDIGHYCQLPVGIRAVVTTSASPGNLAVHVNDDPATVVLHRRQLMRELKLSRAPLWLRQTHSTDAVYLSPEFSPEAQPVTPLIADACWTDALNQPCAILTADCLPILLWHKDGTAVAAVHAGWRGLAAGVVQQTVAQLTAKLGCSTAELSAWIGPAISQAHFEVGKDVYQCFVEQSADNQTYFIATGDRWHADLPGLAEATMQRLGIGQVVQSGWCSYADSSHWYSYRRSPQCGRMASLIWRSQT